MTDTTADVAPLTSAELIELRALLERDAIRRVVAGYARGIDRADEVATRAAYWGDAYDDHGSFKGNAHEFVGWALAAAKECSGHQHVLGQSVIAVDGDHSTCETYFVYYAEEGRSPLPNVVSALAGRYVDSLERRDGEWKISHRVVVIDWSTVWRSDERFPTVDAFVPGKWHPADYSFETSLPSA